MGQGEVGLEPDRGAVFGDGLVVLALLHQGCAEVVVGAGVVGPEPDRRAVFGDGLVELALLPQGEAEVNVGDGEVGLEPDRRAVIRRGSSSLPWSVKALPSWLWATASSGLSRIAAGRASTAASRPRGFPRQPLSSSVSRGRPDAAIAGPQPLRSRNTAMASSDSPRVSRAWPARGPSGADRSRGGVEADGLVAARRFSSTRPESVVDPDIAGMPLLGRSAAPTRPV